jgi:hypothetical protein
MKTTHTQLLILAVTGVLLGAGIWAWQKAHEQPEPIVYWINA